MYVYHYILRILWDRTFTYNTGNNKRSDQNRRRMKARRNSQRTVLDGCAAETEGRRLSADTRSENRHGQRLQSHKTYKKISSRVCMRD